MYWTNPATPAKEILCWFSGNSTLHTILSLIYNSWLMFITKALLIFLGLSCTSNSEVKPPEWVALINWPSFIANSLTDFLGGVLKISL